MLRGTGQIVQGVVSAWEELRSPAVDDRPNCLIQTRLRSGFAGVVLGADHVVSSVAVGALLEVGQAGAEQVGWLGLVSLVETGPRSEGDRVRFAGRPVFQVPTDREPTGTGVLSRDPCQLMGSGNPVGDLGALGGASAIGQGEALRAAGSR
jgi:hypothetical protein